MFASSWSDPVVAGHYVNPGVHPQRVCTLPCYAWGKRVCTTAGTPGTWQHIRAPSVVADPSTVTFPVGCLIPNVSDGAVKRHAGFFSWEVRLGVDAAAKVGLHGVTPVAQAAHIPHIPDPSVGTTVDAQARAVIEAILVALEGKGILANS